MINNPIEKKVVDSNQYSEFDTLITVYSDDSSSDDGTSTEDQLLTQQTLPEEKSGHNLKIYTDLIKNMKEKIQNYQLNIFPRDKKSKRTAMILLGFLLVLLVIYSTLQISHKNKSLYQSHTNKKFWWVSLSIVKEFLHKYKSTPSPNHIKKDSPSTVPESIKKEASVSHFCKNTRQGEKYLTDSKGKKKIV